MDDRARAGGFVASALVSLCAWATVASAPPAAGRTLDVGAAVPAAAVSSATGLSMSSVTGWSAPSVTGPSASSVTGPPASSCGAMSATPGTDFEPVPADPAVLVAGAPGGAPGDARGAAGRQDAAAAQTTGAPGRAAGTPADQGWDEIDASAWRGQIRAGQRLVVRFDAAAQRLSVAAPVDGLTDRARQAVDRAPDWLAAAVADKLGRLSEEAQADFARLILNVEDPIVDEVAFQVAHLGIGPLTDPRFKISLLVDNATAMYEHDPLLRYVDIVDHGSAAGGGDYYSTTRYLVGRAGDPAATQWIEIPREIYYWYVVHPKLSDETVKASRESDERQATYGHFWRRFLFANPDMIFDYSRPDGDAPPYPVLGTVLQAARLVWDGQAVDLPGDRPFGPDDTALDIVGHWVSAVLPDKAAGNRPVQPNQIAFEHNGNCGEIQDLLGAASRTALIPNVLTADQCEDHVWNEVYVGAPAPAWRPFQVDWDGGPTRIDRPGVAYDKDQGGGKDVSGVWAWRSDGFAYDVVDRYSKAAELVVHVEASGKPVDGARVLVFSEAWSGQGFALATFGHTDSNGACHFRLGDHQNYYLRVDSPVGSYPAESNRIVPVVSDAEADATYPYTVRLTGRLRQYADPYGMMLDNSYQMRIRFQATGEVLYGTSPFDDGLDFTDWRSPGQIDFVAFDAANYARFDGGGTGSAVELAENAATGDLTVAAGRGDADAYAVFSNEDHVVNAQIVDVEVTLQRSAALAPRPVYLPVARRDQAD